MPGRNKLLPSLRVCCLYNSRTSFTLTKLLPLIALSNTWSVHCSLIYLFRKVCQFQSKIVGLFNLGSTKFNCSFNNMGVLMVLQKPLNQWLSLNHPVTSFSNCERQNGCPFMTNIVRFFSHAFVVVRLTLNC
jgi:hypothetical protein